MSNLEKFLKQYHKWEQDCLEEYHERHIDCDFVEFSEDGDAYPHGIGGVNWVPNCVTPWEESIHYID